MRLLLAASLLALSSGCLETTGSIADGIDGACNEQPKVVMLLDDYDVIFPGDVPAGDKPRAQVEAVEGGTLTASAIWNQAFGDARLVFDGPAGIETQVAGTWSHTSYDVPAGTYSLWLEGDPVAMGGNFALTLIASGC